LLPDVQLYTIRERSFNIFLEKKDFLQKYSPIPLEINKITLSQNSLSGGGSCIAGTEYWKASGICAITSDQFEES